MRFSERNHLMTILEPKDCEAGLDSDSINMSLMHRVAIILSFGAITGDAVLTFNSGASAGTKTTALAFNYRLSSGDFKASSADLLGAVTAVASTGLTLTAATYDHRTLIIEFEGNQMTDAENWLTMTLDAAASVLLVSAALVAEPRYASNAGTPTVI